VNKAFLLRTAAVVLTGVALLGAAAPASARNIGPDDELVLTGTVRVPRGEHADRIVIGDGRVFVDGEVDGVIFALDAPVHIGRHAVINGDVISISRRVTLERGAILNDDLIYLHEKPLVPKGANVYGEVHRFDAGDLSLPFGAFLLHVAVWVAITVSSLALGLLLLWLAPGAADAAAETARRRPGPAVAWGIGLFLGLPVAAVAAALTLVGIPLGLFVLLALLPLLGLGYVATAYVIGRALLDGSRGRIAAFLTGWAMLRAVAFVPFVGPIAWLAATVFGLGVLTVALWRSRGPLAPRPEPAATTA
jgi:hypothetical protein